MNAARPGSAGLAAWLLRKIVARRVRKEPRLRLVESLALGGRRYVSLLECDGNSFLLAGQGGSVQCIAPVLPQATATPAIANDRISESNASNADIALAHEAVSAHVAGAEAKHDADIARLPGARLQRWLASTVTLRIRHVSHAPSRKENASFAAAMGSAGGKAATARAAVASEPSSINDELRRICLRVGDASEEQEVLSENETLSASTQRTGDSIERELVAWAAAQWQRGDVGAGQAAEERR